MALSDKRLTASWRALNTLESALLEKQSEIVQDACIQRFEYTLDQFWKTLKVVLEEESGVRAGSPKSVLRAWAVHKNYDSMYIESLLLMVDDRNLTTHLYDQETAQLIYSRLPQYAKIMREVLEEFTKSLNT